jgi:HK97 gp10 family phage protein
MSAKVKIVKSNVKEVMESLAGDRLGQAVMAGGFVIEAAVKVSMAASRSGTGLLIGGHQASAPGEPPAIDTGNLVNSIKTELVSSNEQSALAQVGTGVEYAEPLEFGTSRIAPRPFMRPAWDNNIEKVKETIRKIAKSNITSAAK